MKLLQEKPVIVLLAICGFFLLVALGILLLNISRIPTPLILHFDAFHGVDLFGSIGDVWGMWSMGLLICLMNVAIAEIFFMRERVLAYLFVGANVLFAILLMIMMAVVASVN